jgi:hypothetical protein
VLLAGGPIVVVGLGLPLAERLLVPDHAAVPDAPSRPAVGPPDRLDEPSGTARDDPSARVPWPGRRDSEGPGGPAEARPRPGRRTGWPGPGGRGEGVPVGLWPGRRRGWPGPGGRGEGVPVGLRMGRRLQPAGAALAVVALALQPGTVAGLLACGWLAVCVAAAWGAAALAWRQRPPSPSAGAAVVGGVGFLVVGGGWLVISRFGWRPFDLSTDIVRLTAVHFHYAGFGLPILGAAALRASSGNARRVLTGACAAAIVGPPIVALGFVTEAALFQVGGAVVMTIAAWGVAAGTAAQLRDTARHSRAAAALLASSSASPLVAMVLAVQWALAQHAAIPALSVDDMAATHGLLNGLGFVIAGLAGWALAQPPEPEPATPPLASRR